MAELETSSIDEHSLGADASLPLADSSPLAPLAGEDAMLMLHQLTLDTMGHGVCLFDASQRAILFNRQYLTMFDFDPDVVRPGTTFREMLQHLADRGLEAGVGV